MDPLWKEIARVEEELLREVVEQSQAIKACGEEQTQFYHYIITSHLTKKVKRTCSQIFHKNLEGMRERKSMP